MIGRKIIYKETLDSTNNYAANLLERGELVHGTVIMSGEQTAGRGQRGASWISEPFKNLIFTCFLEHDNLSAENQEGITQMTALALVDLLQDFHVPAAIKWPNDILVGNAKIAGVLIENQLTGNRVKSTILGIGLNVNQLDFGGFNATSMGLVTGREFSLESVSFGLIAMLEKWFGVLKSSRYELLKREYLQKLWLLNEPAPFEDETGIWEGTIRGTDASGKLLVEKDGVLKSFDLKEITFLKRNNREA